MPPIILPLSHNVLLLQKNHINNLYSCWQHVHHNLHLASLLCTRLIEDVSSIQDNILYNQCGSQLAVCATFERRCRFRNITTEHISFYTVHTPEVNIFTLNNSVTTSLIQITSIQQYCRITISNTITVRDVPASDISESSNIYFMNNTKH